MNRVYCGGGHTRNSLFIYKSTTQASALRSKSALPDYSGTESVEILGGSGREEGEEGEEDIFE